MELVSLQVAGWKRFREPQTLHTSGKLVAILGPNEAGKSSLLKAIRFLRSPKSASPNDHSRDSSKTELKITGYFAFERSELTQLGLSAPTRAILYKGPDATYGKLAIDPPAPERDVRLRKETVGQIERCLNNTKFKLAVSEQTTENLDAIVKSFHDTQSDLSEEQMDMLITVLKLLEEEEIPKSPGYISNLPRKISDLLTFEQEESPAERVFNYAKANLPFVLFFGEDDRDLAQSYSLDDLSTEIPTALANLAAIAKLDINNLITAVTEADPAKIESIRAQANEELRTRFEQDWSQSGVRVFFAIRDRNLDIVIENEPHKFTNLAERSDGFRQFIALQSFIMKERADRPILLIDEAETHLHYDAQADLVQMLQKQTVVRKVIYSTHSAGCLPEDLGNGVRVIVPSSPQTSKIINRFWGNQGLGFDPLLIGMGASTLAFFPIRKALVVEGEAEMLILPTLLRKLLKVESLNFQVVPGLSRANKSSLPLAASSQKRVAYLVDGDAGGRSLTRELRQNKVDMQSVFSLDASAEADLTLEDVLSDELLIASLSQLIDKFSPGADMPATQSLGRKKFDELSKRYREATGKDLSKIDLAYEILETIRDKAGMKIFDDAHLPTVRKLAKQLAAHFTTG